MVYPMKLDESSPLNMQCYLPDLYQKLAMEIINVFDLTKLIAPTGEEIGDLPLLGFEKKAGGLG
eukprot:7538833-Pyramimonas_sp.AAC.1